MKFRSNRFKKIWGVDFEESRKGKPIEDISVMCSSILTTDPMFTKKKFELAHIFVEYYHKLTGYGVDNLAYYITKSLEIAANYRPSQKKILILEATKIRSEGFF